MINIEVKGVRELSKKIINLQKVLPNTLDRTIKKTLHEGKSIAKDFAPQKTGKLKAGIRIKTSSKKGEGTLTSTVPGDFPYNLWVNRSEGYRTIRGRYPFFLSSGKILYGGSARSPSRNPINWTGVPGFFDKTIKVMEKKFPKNVTSAVNNVIKRSGFK